MKYIYFALVFFVSCKPISSDSESKSLGNLSESNSKLRISNDCSGTNPVSPKLIDRIDFSELSQNKEDIQYSLKRTFSAIPPEFQDFIAPFIKVIPGQKALSECLSKVGISDYSKVASTKERSANEVCWSGNPKDGLTLNIAPDSAAISHHTIRAIGFFFSQVLPLAMSKNLHLFTNSNSPLADVNVAANQRKIKIWNALLLDLKGKKADFKKRMVSAFGSEQEAQSVVFAETFDSYFCSKRTQTELENIFPETRSAFIESKDKKNLSLNGGSSNYSTFVPQPQGYDNFQSSGQFGGRSPFEMVGYGAHWAGYGIDSGLTGTGRFLYDTSRSSYNVGQRTGTRWGNWLFGR